MWHGMELRACMAAILRGCRGGFVHWMGVVCSSYVLTSRGSTGRCRGNPEGDESLSNVQQANIMTARRGGGEGLVFISWWR